MEELRLVRFLELLPLSPLEGTVSFSTSQQFEHSYHLFPKSSFVELELELKIVLAGKGGSHVKDSRSGSGTGMEVV